jgi:hypothetical protein
VLEVRESVSGRGAGGGVESSERRGEVERLEERED